LSGAENTGLSGHEGTPGWDGRAEGDGAGKLGTGDIRVWRLELILALCLQDVEKIEPRRAISHPDGSAKIHGARFKQANGLCSLHLYKDLVVCGCGLGQVILEAPAKLRQGREVSVDLIAFHHESS